MNGDTTITLGVPISKMPNGIKLIFSKAGAGEQWTSYDVSKYQVVNHTNGGGTSFFIFTPWSVAVKYLYINDGTIRGHANNEGDHTFNGIECHNSYYTLRYVIGY
jgi:hypothetical protein